MTATLFLHFSDRELRDVEEASEIDAENGSVVGASVLGEWLGDENAGIVDKGIDAPESTHRLRDDTFGRIPLADIATYCDDAILSRSLYRSGRGVNVLAAIAVCLYEGCADALRRTCDDSNFLHRTNSPV